MRSTPRSGVSKRGQARRAEEFIALLRTLWTDEVVAHDGEFYRVPPTRMDPKPVQRPARRSCSAAVRSRRCAGPAGSPTAGSAAAGWI